MEEGKYYFATVRGGQILGSKIYVYDSKAQESAEKSLNSIVNNDSGLVLRIQEISKEQFDEFKQSDVVKVIKDSISSP